MPRPKNDQSAVALFPFLAVLLCTMGSLILMLVVITRNQADRARREAADAAIANEQAQAAALVEQRDELSWEIEQLADSRKKTAEQLAVQRAQLSHLEEHAQRLRTQLEELDAAEKLLAQQTSLDDATKAKLRAELAELRKKIAETEAKIAIAKAQGKRPPAFAIVPYDGENGTRRRPIYIECREDSIIIHPEGTTFSESDFVGSMGPSNPLASCVRVVAEHHSRSSRSQVAEQPYPLLLVRPSGIGAYYVALEAMQSWDSDFGYELIDDAWPLEFPAANPELAATLARTQNEARQRQVMIARAAPSLRPTERPTFRNAPPSNGMLESEARSGQYAGGGGRGTADSRGGSGYGGPNGNSSSPSGNGYAGGSNGYGASAGGGKNRYADYKPSTGAGGSGTALSGIGGNGGIGTGGAGTGGPANPGSANSGAGNYGMGVGPGGNGLSSLGGAAGYGSQAGGGSAANFTGTSNAVVTPTSFSDGPSLGNAATSTAGGGMSGGNGITSGGNVGGAGSYPGGNNAAVSNGGGPGSTTSTPFGTASNYPMTTGTYGSSAASGGPGGSSSASGNGTAANGGAAGSSGPGGAAGSSFGSMGSSGTSSGSSGGGASSMGDPSMQQAGGTPNLPGNFQDRPSKNVESLAKRRGENWGLPEHARRATGVTRPVQVYCSSDRLTVFSDRGVPDKQINLGPRTEDSVDELVSTVWSQVEAWGMAGRSMYWKPTLSIHVAPDGTERYQELKSLLANSGLDVVGKEITVNSPKKTPQRR